MSRRKTDWFHLLIAGALAMLTGATTLIAASKTAPVDLAAKIAAADDKYDDAAFVVVYESTDVQVADNGMGTNTHTRVVKILNDAGIKSQSTRRWSFDPLTNQLSLKAIRLHRADGSIEQVDIGAAIVQPEKAGIIFWGSKQLVITIPGLEVGDTIEMTHVKIGFNMAYLTGAESHAGSSLKPPMPGHWHDAVQWQESVPILEKRYTARLPKDKPLQYEVVNGELTSSVRFDGDHVIYSFEKKNIPAFKGDARMVSRSDVVCKLVMATLEDWHAKARWFAKANEPSFELDDAIREKVKEIVADRQTDEEKITALNHWVAENVRYVGSTRGAAEGYTTHPVIETFRDRGGVCKDKAGMLVAMLRAAGYESYIVMTMAGSRVEETPADQFNHAVTSVRRKDGSLRLLDPTWMPKSREMWSTAEQLQTVVFGTPDGEAGKQLTDYSPPAENAATWRSTCMLSPHGELRGRIQVSTVGCPETQLRRTLSRFHPKDRRGRIEVSLRKLATNAILEACTLTEPADFSGPAGVSLDYLVPDYALGDGDRQYVRLPAMSGGLWDLILPDLRDSASVKVEDRKYPLKIRSTRRFDCQETIALPSGMKAVRLPEHVSIDGPAAALAFKIASNAGSIRYECRLDIKKHRVPVEDYANYKQVIDKLNDLCESWIVLKKEARRAAR